MPENLNAPVSLQHLHDAEARIVSVLKRFIDERLALLEERVSRIESGDRS